MSSLILGRKSIGSRSNKSGSSKRSMKISSRFLKPTISSVLKRKELGMINESDKNENLTENNPKILKPQKRDSLRAKINKSSLKSASILRNKHFSPTVNPKIQKAPRRINKPRKPSIVNNKENKLATSISKGESLKRPRQQSKIEGLDSIEEIDFKFLIPETFAKKRDKKCVEKVKESKKIEELSSKELCDITNSNYYAIQNSIQPRCVIGKTSAARSSISLLLSDPGSEESTPITTPYKMMIDNKENSKDGTQNIEDLTNKIKKLEENDIYSKNMALEDEYSGNNELLEGISQIGGSELLKKNLEDQEMSLVRIDKQQNEEQQNECVEKEDIIKEGLSKEQDQVNEIAETAEIKEPEAMIGQGFKIEKDANYSARFQNKSEDYGSLTASLLQTTNNDDKIERNKKSSDQAENSLKTDQGSKLSLCIRSKRSRNKQKRRRRSNRTKTTYDHIEIYKQDCWDEEWFKNNEVWTRSRKRRHLAQN
ncbi:unnamed protein product [Moneuplotes crassus]|uniref:Uncharacterized protein n=1 Tax=Euplotes crassus TaxID=5936 RepID=A0AAD1XAX4_EUPCR|nr:unnamed protein product [Moneuplotes crassus]